MENDKRIKLLENAKACSKCGVQMTYIYGEMFECKSCGNKELSDFGIIKEFLEKNGPRPAIVIHDKTGIPVDYINKLLREGRMEIPDGSDSYIKCQKCGTDIRYGKYCPDCMITLTKNVSQALWMPEVGEKPKIISKKNSEISFASYIKRKEDR